MFQAFIEEVKTDIPEELPKSTDEELRKALIKKWSTLTKEGKAAFQQMA